MSKFIHFFFLSPLLSFFYRGSFQKTSTVTAGLQPPTSGFKVFSFALKAIRLIQWSYPRETMYLCFLFPVTKRLTILHQITVALRATL